MSLIEYIKQGGTIMYVLVFLNVLGFSLLIWKTLEFIKVKKSKSSLLTDILQDVKSRYNEKFDSHILITIIQEEISASIQKLESGLSTVKMIATISPLLGLLGTVVGILLSFRVISQEGLSNHALFADGISMALITTVGGLIVSIPHTIGYHYFISFLDSLEVELEKQVLPQMLNGEK